jgi:hypothetical protein
MAPVMPQPITPEAAKPEPIAEAPRAVVKTGKA